MKKIHFIFFIFAVLFSNCQSALELKIEEESPKMVVNCIMEADSAWRLHLHESGALQGALPIKHVQNATIEVYEGGKLLTKLNKFVPNMVSDGFFEKDKSYYTNADVNQNRPQAGHTYTLKIQAKGFPNVEATEQIPEQPLINDFKVSPIEKIYNPILALDTLVEGSIQFSLTKRNPTKIAYYSHLYWYKANRTSSHFSSSSQTKKDTSYFFKEDAHFTGLDGNDNQVGFFAMDGVFAFPDSLLKTNTTVLKSDIPLFYFLSSKIPPFIFFELRNISPSYYKYAETYEKQLSVSKDPFSEAQPVYSNIVGGYGIFTGYSAKRFFISLK